MLEALEVVFELISTLLMVFVMPLIPFLFIGGVFYIIFKHAKENAPKNLGERKAVQQDDRIVLIYKIKKDDPDFIANEIEQYILNHLNKTYPNLIFRESDFKIIDYAKINDTAQITYSILETSNIQHKIEYQVILQMKIKGSDDMANYTRECGNCGAVIENENLTACPYCGHTYNFQKYNKWQIKEVTKV